MPYLDPSRPSPDCFTPPKGSRGSEATMALPILASYAYHKGSWKKRRARQYNVLLNDEKAPVPSALR